MSLLLLIGFTSGTICHYIFCEKIFHIYISVLGWTLELKITLFSVCTCASNAEQMRRPEGNLRELTHSFYRVDLRDSGCLQVRHLSVRTGCHGGPIMNSCSVCFCCCFTNLFFTSIMRNREGHGAGLGVSGDATRGRDRAPRLL